MGDHFRYEACEEFETVLPMVLSNRSASVTMHLANHNPGLALKDHTGPLQGLAAGTLGLDDILTQLNLDYQKRARPNQS